MYLYASKLDTVTIAPTLTDINVLIGQEWQYAGKARLMVALVQKANKVVCRPNGKLCYPSDYTKAMAVYDFYTNKRRVVEPREYK